MGLSQGSKAKERGEQLHCDEDFDTYPLEAAYELSFVFSLPQAVRDSGEMDQDKSSRERQAAL